jgi:hypothetical protein
MAFEVAFRKKLSVGISNGESGNAEFRREHPAGRDLMSGAQIPAQNRRPESLIQLPVQRKHRSAVNCDHWQCAGRDASSGSLSTGHAVTSKVIIGNYHF